MRARTRGTMSADSENPDNPDDTARLRLVEAIRRAIDASLVADVPGQVLAAAATDIEHTVEALMQAGSTEKGRAHRLGDTYRSHDDYLPGSPIVGAENPLAPFVTIDITPEGVTGRVVFGAPYEGPPGHVHGGVIASTFDELLSIANIRGEAPGVTGRLTVHYRKPTPLHREVLIETWHDRRQGRRIIARGTMTVDGEVTAEAEGLFIGGPETRAEQHYSDE